MSSYPRDVAASSIIRLENRLSLGRKPSPLRYSPSLSKELGIQLYIKHDDELDPHGSGGKLRKLEFLFKDALSSGCDFVVTAGSYLSNQCRVIAYYARQLGLQSSILLVGPSDFTEANGNHLLTLLLGTHVQHVESDDWDEVDALLQEEVRRLESAGHKPYKVSSGASDWLGSLGYVEMAAELAQQEVSSGIWCDHVVLPTASGGTHTGIAVGAALADRKWKVHGICVYADSEHFQKRHREIVKDMVSAFPVLERFLPIEIELFEGALCGGYLKTDNELLAAVIDAAQTHGLILDPMYTGKSFVGMRRLIEQGVIAKGSNVVFVHTGGNYLLFDAWPAGIAALRKVVAGHAKTLMH